MKYQFQVNKKDEAVEWYVDFLTTIVLAKTKEEALKEAQRQLTEGVIEIASVELVTGQQ